MISGYLTPRHLKATPLPRSPLAIRQHASTREIHETRPPARIYEHRIALRVFCEICTCLSGAQPTNTVISPNSCRSSQLSSPVDSLFQELRWGPKEWDSVGKGQMGCISSYANLSMTIAVPVAFHRAQLLVRSLWLVTRHPFQAKQTW
jgi:hypothetical protein